MLSFFFHIMREDCMTRRPNYHYHMMSLLEKISISFDQVISDPICSEQINSLENFDNKFFINFIRYKLEINK